MKTPEQVTQDAFDAYAENLTPDECEAFMLDAAGNWRSFIEDVIRVDRAQRAELVDPDWQDDADMYRDAAAVDISWRAWDASGRQIGYSDAGINGAQAAAMFEAIGRLEA